LEARKVILYRIYIAFFLICIFGIVVIIQIGKIQFVQGNYWKDKADSLMLQYITIDAARGNIFAEDGVNLLATSVPIYDVHFDTRAGAITSEIFSANVDSLAHGLSLLFKDKSQQDYRQQLVTARAKKERYHLIRRGISYPELQQLKQLPVFRMGRYKGGLLVEQKSKRELPFRELAKRTIGTMRDVKPVGIEEAFNDELKGVSGKRLMQKISGNTWKPVNDKDEIEPKDGNDIITTIDRNIQDVAENSLEEHLRLRNADHGCAILMEVETGEIKAIANLSRTKDSSYVENFNYAIAEATEPGSTFKMASMLAAIDDGFVDTSDVQFVGNGETVYFGHKMEDAHPPHESRLTVSKIFATSSNVGTSRIIYNNYAKRPQDFIDKLHSFGLGTPLGLQIKGEGQPLVKNTTDKSWSGISLPWISIGYESKLTPLQILAFYNAVANNGRMIRPKFVKEVRHRGQLVHSYPTEIIRDSIASQVALAKVRGLMEGVVQYGSGAVLNKSPYKVAGKTGTARINKPKFGYNKNNVSYQASFVGYFPADRPKYSCIVVVYAPSNDVYYGGAVAAPVFKDIADKVYSTRLDLHAAPLEKDTNVSNPLPVSKAGDQKDMVRVLDEMQIVHTTVSEASWVGSSADKNAVSLSPRKYTQGGVPNVVGMGLRDALFLLENEGLNVKVMGRGHVVHQSLTAGSSYKKGQIISLELR
jgi:cell division protein FtsI (penicillin-binding protein 3)